MKDCKKTGHVWKWSGRIPNTGILVCLYCNEPKVKQDGKTGLDNEFMRWYCSSEPCDCDNGRGLFTTCCPRHKDRG